MKTNSKGQVVLILLLITTVGLGIGLSIIQRSLSDVSSATKVEQSSRAFSAAEAGIERALRIDGDVNSSVDLGNQSQIERVQKTLVPGQNQALEYLPLSKEEIAHFWLANPASTPPSSYYTQSSFDFYFGSGDLTATSTDKPAIELTVISDQGSNYLSRKYFFDADNSRISGNGFTAASCTNFSINSSLSPDLTTTDRRFFCRANVSGYAGTPILVRARILYSGTSHPVALKPIVTGGCIQACSLPQQGRLFRSIGRSGDTQRAVQLFELDKVVPFYFDYAIFSNSEIEK